MKVSLTLEEVVQRCPHSSAVMHEAFLLTRTILKFLKHNLDTVRPVKVAGFLTGPK
jgi:hypothetical protein